MKKILIITVILFITVTLTACTSSSTSIESGVWNDDIFVNESLGIQFQLPHDWELVEEEDFSGILGNEVVFLSDLESDFDEEEILEKMENKPLHDIYAVNSSTDATLQVMVRRLPESASHYSPEGLLNLIFAEIEEGVGSLSRLINSGRQRIGNYDFYFGGATTTIEPYKRLSIQTYLRLDGRNMTIIILTASNLSEFSDVLYFINEPGADRIEIELVEASDLIGTWEWEEYEGYSLIFNEDGTGVRGYLDISIDDVMDSLSSQLEQETIEDLLDELSEEELLELVLEREGLVEEFEWEVSGNVLYMNFASVTIFGMMNEEWEIAIEEEVLTIENLQASDIRFSYIRK